jgi:hypothetical protein
MAQKLDVIGAVYSLKSFQIAGLMPQITPRRPAVQQTVVFVTIGEHVGKVAAVVSTTGVESVLSCSPVCSVSITGLFQYAAPTSDRFRGPFD